MTYRVTQKDLDEKCRQLNIKTKNPIEMFKERTIVPNNYMNEGHFYTQTQEGGTRLEQISKSSKGGGHGACDISPFRGTKREIFDYINAMLIGIEHFENSQLGKTK